MSEKEMRAPMDRFAGWTQTRAAKRVMVAFIVAYSAFFYVSGSWLVIPDLQSRQETTGLAHHLAKRFVYFYYYLGLFPVATLDPQPQLSAQGAIRELKEDGRDLVMEVDHWSRLGEHARILLYMPDALLRGSPGNPSIRLFNTLLFMTALLVLYLGFFRAGQPLAGTVLTLLICATPYFIFEIFERQNVFGMLGAGFFLILGLQAKSLFCGDSNLDSVISTLLGAVSVGFMAEVRNETSVLLAVLIILIVAAKGRKWPVKLALVCLSLISFYATKQGIRTWFEKEYQEAYSTVKNHGGHVYDGARLKGHVFWTPVFCGLGDFDTKYGYKWDDRVAFAYATPILNHKYGLGVKYSGAYRTDNYYDPGSLYYVKFDEMPEYEPIIKEKVLRDISNDPWWYIQILFKRIVAQLTVTLPVPLLGWLIFPVAYLMWRSKSYAWLALLIASFPLMATAILIYSGDGATYNATFGFIVLAFLATHYAGGSSSSSRDFQATS